VRQMAALFSFGGMRLPPLFVSGFATRRLGG
jgi:hypothetical protein